MLIHESSQLIFCFVVLFFAWLFWIHHSDLCLTDVFYRKSFFYFSFFLLLFFNYINFVPFEGGVLERGSPPSSEIIIFFLVLFRGVDPFWRGGGTSSVANHYKRSWEAPERGGGRCDRVSSSYTRGFSHFHNKGNSSVVVKRAP